ncbi:TetR family transcriptional regulator [Undibacterium sp. TJN19]|uniref:TetR/AcrR family transcriptional regulator n=1 Tax=Undibacterium sp. TJN19 TaxID=3413055 RepID=UPI003BF3267D
MVTRAKDDEAKQARRTDILLAARRLFMLDPHQLPSALRIAEESGLAKGTVYLYFSTKEEIFLALLEEEFALLLDEVRDIFSAGQQVTASGFITRYVNYLEARPEMLRLDAMAHSVLEQNMQEDKLRAFKLNLIQALMQTGAVLDQTLQLTPGRGASLLTRTHAITRGLWQSLDYSPLLQEILKDPVFAPIRPDFKTELAQTLEEYWRGALGM